MPCTFSNGYSCLLLAGEHDALRPPDQVKAIVSQIEGARFDAIDSAHIMPVQAPEAMSHAVSAFFTK